MNPSLKNPEFAKRMIAPGPHLAKHLRTLVSGKGGPTKAQIEKEKQEARLSLLT
jgi:predicted outer membrane protein